MAWTRRGTLALLLFGAIVGAGIGRATGASSSAPTRWPATVRCAAMAEDTAAHVRLVVFDRTPEGIRLVYRCEKGGY